MPVAVVVTVAAHGFGAVAGQSRSVGSAIADSTDQKVSPSSCNSWEHFHSIIPQQWIRTDVHLLWLGTNLICIQQFANTKKMCLFNLMPPATRCASADFPTPTTRYILPPKSPNCPETPQWKAPNLPTFFSALKFSAEKESIQQVCWFQFFR